MKRFISIFLALLMVICFAGCGRPDESIPAWKESQNERKKADLEEMGLMFIGDVATPDSNLYNCRLVYDSETMVVYYLSFSYNGGLMMCPRYDTDGDVMIYEGD